MISAAAADAAECSIVTSPRPFDRLKRLEMAFAKNKTKPSAEIFLHNEAIEIFCFDAARCDLWKNEELVETNVLTLSFLVAKNALWRFKDFGIHGISLRVHFCIACFGSGFLFSYRHSSDDGQVSLLEGRTLDTSEKGGNRIAVQ